MGFRQQRLAAEKEVRAYCEKMYPCLKGFAYHETAEVAWAMARVLAYEYNVMNPPLEGFDYLGTVHVFCDYLTEEVAR